jgi:hypothetical protein
MSCSERDVENRVGVSAEFVGTLLTDERVAKLKGSEVPGEVLVAADVAGSEEVLFVRSHELIILYYRPSSTPNLRKSKKSCCRKCLGIHDLGPLAAAPPKFVKGKIKKPPRDAPPEGCPFPDGLSLSLDSVGDQPPERLVRQI